MEFVTMISYMVKDGLTAYYFDQLIERFSRYGKVYGKQWDISMIYQKEWLEAIRCDLYEAENNPNGGLYKDKLLFRSAETGYSYVFNPIIPKNDKGGSFELTLDFPTYKQAPIGEIGTINDRYGLLSGEPM